MPDARCNALNKRDNQHFLRARIDARRDDAAPQQCGPEE
jgi:hypothetical protein